MGLLRADRAGLRDLLAAVLGALRPLAGTAPIAAIGFCFGGQCVLDLARSGADIAAVASFHGLLDPPGLDPRPIAARVIAFHGWADPLARPDSVVALGEELTAAGCDWQIHGYGGVGHAFTNPGATGAMPGIQYDEAAARRSWTALDQFLGELA
jgi:dienelactone hydrolase